MQTPRLRAFHPDDARPRAAVLRSAEAASQATEADFTPLNRISVLSAHAEQQRADGAASARRDRSSAFTSVNVVFRDFLVGPVVRVDLHLEPIEIIGEQARPPAPTGQRAPSARQRKFEINRHLHRPPADGDHDSRCSKAPDDTNGERTRAVRPPPSHSRTPPQILGRISRAAPTDLFQLQPLEVVMPSSRRMPNRTLAPFNVVQKACAYPRCSFFAALRAISFGFPDHCTRKQQNRLRVESHGKRNQPNL